MKAFTEKPDHDTAVRFIESGEFLWNAGIFIWSLASIRKAYRDHLPAMEERFNAGEAAFGTSSEGAFIASIYDSCENVSIDYGIMEKAKNVFTIASDFGWSDLGTWEACTPTSPKTATRTPPLDRK